MASILKKNKTNLLYLLVIVSNTNITRTQTVKQFRFKIKVVLLPRAQLREFEFVFQSNHDLIR